MCPYGESMMTVILTASTGAKILVWREKDMFAALRPGGREEARRRGGREEALRPGGRKEILRPGGHKETLRPGGHKVTPRPGGDKEALRPGRREETLRPGGHEEAQICLGIDLFEVIAELAGLDLDNEEQSDEATRLAREAQHRLGSVPTSRRR